MASNGLRESKHPADHSPKVWDAQLEPIVDLVLSKNGPKLGNAAEVGRRAVRYVRAKDLIVWLWNNWDEVASVYKGDPIKGLLALNKEHSAEKLETFPENFDENNLRPNDMKPLAELILRKKFIYRADRHEIKVSQIDNDDGSDACSDKEAVDEEVNRLLEKDKRWPKKLLPYPVHVAEGMEFSLTSVYVIAYERSQDKKWNFMLLTIFAVLAFVVCGYPAWPMWAKEYIAYLSLFLFSLLMFISVLRLITFGLLWYCGYDFWIMPNLWADDLGLIDIFRPVYSWAPRNDGKVMYVVRLFAFVMMCLSFVKLGERHSLSDIGEFAAVQYLEFVDWGVNKMTGQGEDLAQVNTGGFGNINVDLNELLRDEEEEDEQVEEKEEDSDESEEVVEEVSEE